MRLLIEALGFTGSVWFHVSLEGPALAAHARAKAGVEGILGRLDDAGDPHVTVLYMGRLGESVSETNIDLIARDATEALDGQEVVASGLPIGFFEPSKASEGRTPIIMPLDAPGFEKANTRLLRRLVPYTNKQQFVDFKPHATIGYLPRTMMPEERRAMSRILVPYFEWRVGSIDFSAGDRLVKRYRLAATP